MELIDLHYERIYGWLRRLTGHDEDAADLTQKTFMRAWQSLARFEGRSSFSTWLHGIGHHVYLDWRRLSKPADHLPDAWWDNCPSEEPLPSEAASERELAAQLYEQVDALEEGIRQAIHLHYYEGLTLAETAEALDVAASTVKYRLRQGLDQLRQRLREPKTI
jgi:RNA polymerase sigma-70 factor (ECF subfamily)